MQMEAVVISCLDPLVQEVHTAELTQQIKLPDGMPDLGRVLGSWGQVILRGKEWREEELIATGGVLVWVLYQPEDGSEPCWMDSWIPFQMKWELPGETEEGNMRLQHLIRFVDGRSVSPRKIMVRCGISAWMEATVPVKREVMVLAEEDRDVEILKSTYPLRLTRETGEKVFTLDETMELPDSAPQPEKLVYFRMEPRIADCRVLEDKLAFRGSGNLHILYRSEEGKFCSWDGDIPFSQIAELDREYGVDSRGNVIPAVTNLEAELDDEGRIRVKTSIASQYQISDRQMVTLVEDAYSPGREVTVRREMLELPVILESRMENIRAEMTLPGDGQNVADLTFLADFPKIRTREDGLELVYPGCFQMLYYDREGVLQAASSRWEHTQQLQTHEDCELRALPCVGASAARTGTQLQAQSELAVELTTTARQNLPMITGLEPGQKRIPDPDRPALILRRAGENRLWDIAKSSGSTVADIRRANSLQGEPIPGQLLLIPIP